MFSNKLLLISLALFALVLAGSAQENEEKIADRRFRWEGSNEQQEEAAEGEPENEQSDDAEEPKGQENEDEANEAIVEDATDGEENNGAEQAENEAAEAED